MHYDRLLRPLIMCALAWGAAAQADEAQYRYDQYGKIIQVVKKEGGIEISTFRPDGQPQKTRHDASHEQDIAPPAGQSR